MLQISPQMRVLVAVEPIDFRRGMDGLVRECRENLVEDPFRGTVFVFRNRRRTAIKILAYDGQGFWLCQKRLSDGKFPWWPSSESDSRVAKLAAHELHVLLSAGDPSGTNAAPEWRSVCPAA